MRSPRRSVPALEVQLAEIRRAIPQHEHDREQSEKLAGQAAVDKRENADDAQAFEDAAQRERRHRDEVERLGAVLALRAKDVADLERRIATATFDEAYAGVVSAAERRRAASEKLSSALVPAVKAMTARDAAHDELTAAIEHARALVPRDLSFELPPSVDECELPAGADQLARALREGPRRPLATTAAAVAKQERERQRAEDGRLRSLFDRYFDHGDGLSDIKRLPPEHLASAATYFERRLSRERASSSEVFVERLEQRLERLRALASETATAA